LAIFLGSELPVLEAVNRAVELEFSNMVDGIQQEIEIETSFGEVL
jgi:hypothetical protein